MQETTGAINVQVPEPAQDRPKWKSVAVIAGIGFVVGVAWPRLAGVRLGPSLPEPSAAPSIAPSATLPPSAPSASAPAPVASAATPPAIVSSTPPLASAPAGQVVSVASGAVQSCKTTDGDALKGSECGKLPGLDGLVLPRLRKLADCPDAADASGRLPLVVRLDFAHNTLTVDLGHGHNVASPEALLACARTDLAGANLARVAHDNQRYNVAYPVTFGGGGRSTEGGSPPARSAADPADATATVVWEVAIVRDVPKTGKVLARLSRGTQLRVGPVKDGWYPVQYGDGFASEGWVYRGAIGR
jgi:hypothetical protein